MAVTQKEIADSLGLSQSLVAGVLNNRDGVWISAENRERILSTARKMNYRPHAAARALRLGKTAVVACVFCGKAWGSAIGETLANSLAEIGYDLLLTVIPEPSQIEARLGKILSPGTCDAIVFWGLEESVEGPASIAAKSGIPFIVKGRFEDTHPDWLQVDFDHEGMMDRSVSHLKKIGHSRIAYIGHSQGIVYQSKLLNGYKQAFSKHFGDHEDPLIAATHDNLLSSNTLEDWYELPTDCQPTGFVIGTDYGTWHALEMWLANKNKKLADLTGNYSASGQGVFETPLLYGEAYGFSNIDMIDLADIIGSQLLTPMLTGKIPSEKIIRILPPFQLVKSMSLPLPFKDLRPE